MARFSRLVASTTRIVSSASIALTVALGTASADEPVAPTSTSTSATTSATTTPAPTAGPYAIAIQEGYAKLREGDSQGAQLAFQRATTADATKSEGHYLLGVAMIRNGSRDPAIASFRAALERAHTASDLVGEGRALLAIARALATTAREHHSSGHHARETSTATAAQAWNEVVAFATAHPEVLSPEIPRAESAAHDRVRELATRMEPVRSRIAAREREARSHPAGHGGR